MNKKVVLKSVVLLFMLIGIISVVRIFIGSLSPSAREEAQIVKIGLLEYNLNP